MSSNEIIVILDSGRPETVLELECGREYDNEWAAAFQFISRPTIDGRVRDEQHLHEHDVDDEQQPQQHIEYNENPTRDSVLNAGEDQQQGRAIKEEQEGISRSSSVWPNTWSSYAKYLF